MKNKISGKIVALLLTLIIVATSGMPLYAKETGDKANSFRYENGQPIIKAVPFATLSPNAWKKIDGKYYSSDGSVIEGAVANIFDFSLKESQITAATTCIVFINKLLTCHIFINIISNRYIQSIIDLECIVLRFFHLNRDWRSLCIDFA